MKFQKIIIITLLQSLIIDLSIAQPLLPVNNDFNFIFEQSVVYNTNFHTSIRPFNLNEIQIDSARINPFINYNFFKNGEKTVIYPIGDYSFSKSIKNDNGLIFSAGAGFMAKPGNKWYIQINVTENLSKFPLIISEKIDSNRIIPHFGRYLLKSGNWYNYPLITGQFQYSPWSFLSLAAGVDKHFIGDGYRSMLLSDNAAPYPFASIMVHIWRIKYLALWAKLNDIDSYSGNTDFHSKFAAIHYFSYNMTNRINIGFFEAVIWQGQDSAVQRGFDFNYLNPVIYYRPVEFSLNSPDNANLGGSLKIRLWKRTFIYGQLFLDDFNFHDFIKNDGWWVNKYGIQAGFKCQNFANLDGLFFQAEYNFARPFTYSHSSSLTNYGNEYQPLAHPLGANFDEMVCIFRYSSGRWLFSLKTIGAMYGLDTSKISYGKNIYISYNLRNTKTGYGVFTGQGLQTYSIYNEAQLSYLIVPKWNFCLKAGFRSMYRTNNLSKESNNYFFIGISTLLYNNDVDY